MTVYVDDMRAKFGRMVMCHMIADTDTELHAMADTIGLARKWFQGDHYDISLSLRAKAIAAGAQEVTWMDVSRMHYVRVHTGVLPAPDDAEYLMEMIRVPRPLTTEAAIALQPMIARLRKLCN